MPEAVRNIRPTLAALLLLAVSAAALAAACTSGDDGSLSVTGQVVAVVPRTISEFESLSILDEDGMTWEFQGGLFSGFTPSHLQEHMALGDPVKVWYVQNGDARRVTRIEDG